MQPGFEFFEVAGVLPDEVLGGSDLGQHGLRPRTIASVLGHARAVLLVPEVLSRLRLERGLQHRLRQPAQQATGPDEADALLLGRRGSCSAICR